MWVTRQLLIERLYRSERSHPKKNAWNTSAVRLIGVTSSLECGCEDRGRQAQYAFCAVVAEREQAKLRQGNRALSTPFRRINGRSAPMRRSRNHPCMLANIPSPFACFQ